MDRNQKIAPSLLPLSERMACVGRLAAGIAHEINNPMGFINSNLSSLQRYIDDLLELVAAYQQAELLLPPGSPAEQAVVEATARADLDFLRQDVAALVRESLEGVGRVKRIIQDLKDFSHQGSLEWEEADLHHELDSMLHLLSSDIRPKALVVREYGNLPGVECMPSQLNQVFMHILVNAIQAIERQGTITVRTGADRQRVWVEIADTGRGIPEEHLAHIFEPFFTTRSVGEGTGLGLSAAYGIVRRHGGSIEVASEVGKGSRFRISLPRERATAQAETRPDLAGGCQPIRYPAPVTIPQGREMTRACSQ